MDWLWGTTKSSYVAYCGRPPQVDLPFFRIDESSPWPVMEWSYDGPFTTSQHRWILFGPFDSKEDAKDFVYWIPKELVRGWEVYRVYSHVRNFALTSRAYTDG